MKTACCRPWTLLAAPALLVFLLGCAARLSPSAAPPPAPREFRGLWVASVANIDWPSAPGLPAEVQQDEARALVALARRVGLNAILLQVRPAADALYTSDLEPWSEYLTGVQGQSPGYDPLAFWIDEAHRAGLELHAWFNPFRARHASARSPLAAGHVAVAHPAWVKAYGDQFWLDPGEPAAADHSLAVILDVVRRYDVDGVHLDDYFYPYPVTDVAGLRLDFPDEASWRTGGGALLRADWRRRNVDGFIERLYLEVHRAKPQVRVGISPFGLGRPDLRPPGVTGFSQYDEIYADVETWLDRGWMDYLAPQLYWPRDTPGRPFAVLLDGWRGRNPLGRHVWPGLFTSRVPPWPAEEILAQIDIARGCSGSRGHIHFSAIALKKDAGGVATALLGTYAEPALVPACPWLGGTAPAPPAARLQRTGDRTAVQVGPGGAAPWKLAVWARYGRTWRFFLLPGSGGPIPSRIEPDPLAAVLVSAVDRSGLESPRVAAVEAP